MKKYIVCVLLLMLLLCLIACNKQKNSTPSDSNDISNYIIVEDEESFLVMPISQQKVWIRDKQKKYINNIDVDLLRTAEEKLNNELSQYGRAHGFYLSIDNEGYICLETEVIVELETNASQSERGCNIDHQHKFYRERISK